jgi:hypothetical protein
MPPLNHPKGSSGHAAKHDPAIAASDLIARGRQVAAAHAKRPTQATQNRLRAMHGGSGAVARRPDHGEGE